MNETKLNDSMDCLGQIDVASRNAEIYRKHTEGKTQSQLAKEYSLSPEWIRRICEDEERKRGPVGGSLAAYVVLIDGSTQRVFWCHGDDIHEVGVGEELLGVINRVKKMAGR